MTWPSFPARADVYSVVFSSDEPDLSAFDDAFTRYRCAAGSIGPYFAVAPDGTVTSPSEAVEGSTFGVLDLSDKHRSWTMRTLLDGLKDAGIMTAEATVISYRPTLRRLALDAETGRLKFEPSKGGSECKHITVRLVEEAERGAMVGWSVNHKGKLGERGRTETARRPLFSRSVGLASESRRSNERTPSLFARRCHLLTPLPFAAPSVLDLKATQDKTSLAEVRSREERSAMPTTVMNTVFFMTHFAPARLPAQPRADALARPPLPRHPASVVDVLPPRRRRHPRLLRRSLPARVGDQGRYVRRRGRREHEQPGQTEPVRLRGQGQGQG